MFPIDAKPCPFCGGTDLATPPGVATVVCGSCGAAGPSAKPHPYNDALTEIAAYSKWNDRAESSVEQHKLSEQIAADKYLESKKASRAKNLGVKLAKISPGGSV